MKNLLFLLLALVTLSSCGHMGDWTAQLSNGSKVRIESNPNDPSYKVGDTVAIWQSYYSGDWRIDNDGHPLTDTTIFATTYYKAILID